MTSIIPIPNRPTLPLSNKEGVFPVSRIFGIGRNYSEDPLCEKKDKALTVLFMKDPYMLTYANESIAYPNDTKQLRYEIELVIAIGQEGKNIPSLSAHEYIYGYAVGIDFTKHDVQEIAKQHAWPWDRSKSFPGCSPCSSITPKTDVSLQNNKIWLKKNNIDVQNGTLSQMIWTIPEVVMLISSEFGLLPGDLIFTGTPQGTGMVSKGDLLEGAIEGLNRIIFKIN